MKTPTFGFFQVADTIQPLARCALELYDQFTAHKREPGADHWTRSAESRVYLFGLVRAEWAKETGLPNYDFPWSESGVMSLWQTIRKANEQQMAGLRMYCSGSNLF